LEQEAERLCRATGSGAARKGSPKTTGSSAEDTDKLVAPISKDFVVAGGHKGSVSRRSRSQLLVPNRQRDLDPSKSGPVPNHERPANSEDRVDGRRGLRCQTLSAALSDRVLILWIYCIYDVITTDDAIIRHLPKVVWLLIVILLSDIGSILVRIVPPSTALDDGSLDHLSPIVRHREEQTRLHLWETQLQRREEELQRRELGEESSP